MVRPVKAFAEELLCRGYACAPAPLAKLAVLGRRILAPLAELRVPLAWHRGKTRAGRSAVVLTAGDGLTTDYFLKRLFAEPPCRVSVGSVWISSLPAALQRLRSEADLTLAEVDRIGSRRLFGGDYLRIPSWLGTRLQTPDDVAVYARRNKSALSDWNLVKRHGLYSEVSHAPADLGMFRREMYLPLANRRYGAASLLRTAAYMRRGFRKGGIIWVRNDERRVAGILYRLYGKAMELLCLGTTQGDYEVVHQGALAATYLFSIELAQKLGCQSIDFGGTRPCARDGVLAYKRKWGIEFAAKHDARTDLLLRWDQVNPVVEEFLAHSPICFRDDDKLSIVTAGSDGPGARRPDQFLVNGIDRIYVAGTRVRQDEPPSTEPDSAHVVHSDPLHDPLSPGEARTRSSMVEAPPRAPADAWRGG